MPIPRQAVRIAQTLKNPAVREMTMNLVEAASRQPDLAVFTMATLKNTSHTSNSDPRPHVTVLVATEEQARADRCHAVHIYHDGNWNYTGHELFPERNRKITD
ncbi:hypothetical protein GGR51DRAFT_527898, partial [Nemania sp. FL0031]